MNGWISCWHMSACQFSSFFSLFSFLATTAFDCCRILVSSFLRFHSIAFQFYFFRIHFAPDIRGTIRADWMQLRNDNNNNNKIVFQRLTLLCSANTMKRVNSSTTRKYSNVEQTRWMCAHSQELTADSLLQWVWSSVEHLYFDSTLRAYLIASFFCVTLLREYDFRAAGRSMHSH